MNLTEQSPLSVAVYISQVNKSLKSHAGRVRGEVTSIKESGNAYYFKVKDTEAEAILDCMIWRNVYAANSIDLKTGDQIIITGAPEIYAPYGIFRFMVSAVEYEGEGRLKQEYEKLKAQLKAAGLFEQERKQMLPPLPKKIGVITPKSGVVFDDFTNNLNRYGFKITKLYSQVEGKNAIHDILNAIHTMSKQDIDVLVIIRGGGAWESLQPFNTESVVKAIAGFKHPVLTGIGHDVDVTLSELVADFGLSTPTAVAQALNSPWDKVFSLFDVMSQRTMRSYSEWLNTRRRILDRSSESIFKKYNQALSSYHSRLSRATSTVKNFYISLERQITRINSGLQSATAILKTSIRSKYVLLDAVQERVLTQAKDSIRNNEQRINMSSEFLVAKFNENVRLTARDMDFYEKTLKANDPRRLMKSGYSLSYVNGKLARNLSDVSKGDTVKTQLADGEFTSEVKGLE